MFNLMCTCQRMIEVFSSFAHNYWITETAVCTILKICDIDFSLENVMYISFFLVMSDYTAGTMWIII